MAHLRLICVCDATPCGCDQKQHLNDTPETRAALKDAADAAVAEVHRQDDCARLVAADNRYDGSPLALREIWSEICVANVVWSERVAAEGLAAGFPSISILYPGICFGSLFGSPLGPSVASLWLPL